MCIVCEQMRILRLRFHAAEMFLHFQSDFSPEFSRPAEKYLGGIEHQSKNRGEKLVRVYIQQPKNGESSGNHWDSLN